MADLLKQLLDQLSSDVTSPETAEPVSREAAILLACLAYISAIGSIRCEDTLPQGVKLYSMPSEPCWFITFAGASSESPIIIPSQLIIIAKSTGRVLYHGSAYDEG